MVPPLKRLVITDWFYTDDWFRVPMAGVIVCGLLLEGATTGFGNTDGNGRRAATSVAARVANVIRALFRYALFGIIVGFVGRLMHNASRRGDFIRQQCMGTKKHGKWRMDQLHYECEKHTGNFCNAGRAGNREKCNTELLKKVLLGSRNTQDVIASSVARAVVF